ncbi:NAD-dependent epimerase/dehydratase family protein [Streptomyces sp. NPDC059467]|uniref:NAD-dependent epimerase/dehydratase family protein n=1 Tax=Streptomyces sp. NPDC059467 TaxID=3346844 RepID=UPI00367C3EE7
MSRVVVTGAAGMLGTALVDRFVRDGHQVVGLDLLPPAAAHPDVEWIEGDIRDPATVGKAVRGADLVLHSATALPTYAEHEIRSINVDGARTLLTGCRDADVPRVIHLSSAAVYGVPRTVPTPEVHPPQPCDPYSRSKAAAEEVVAEFRAAGMVIPALRAKTFVGPGRLGLFAMLFEWADEGHHFPMLGGGDVRSQMLDVDDLVDAVAAAAAHPDDNAVNTAFNIAATEFRTLRQDFQSVLDAAGHGKRVVALPTAPAVAVLKVLSRTGLSPVYGRLLQKLQVDSYVSTERAAEVLGFRPRYSNREALLRTFDWWRREHARSHGAPTGRTSRAPWKQGALSLGKALF